MFIKDNLETCYLKFNDRHNYIEWAWAYIGLTCHFDLRNCIFYPAVLCIGFIGTIRAKGIPTWAYGYSIIH